MRLNKQVNGKLYGDYDCPDPIYKGIFNEGKFEKGDVHTFYKNGNSEYIGQFDMGFYHGRGALYHPNGALLYQGFFKNGREQGKEVVIYDMDGKISLIASEIENGEPLSYIEAYQNIKSNCVYFGEFNDEAREKIVEDTMFSQTRRVANNDFMFNNTCKALCNIF